MAEISNSPWHQRCANNLRTKRFDKKVKAVDDEGTALENRSKTDVKTSKADAGIATKHALSGSQFASLGTMRNKWTIGWFVAHFIDRRTFEMKPSLKLFLAVAAIATAAVVSSEPLLARGGGGGNIMNSPGYQRRLQESRQQLSPPPAQPSSAQRHRGRHRH